MKRSNASYKRLSEHSGEIRRAGVRAITQTVQTERVYSAIQLPFAYQYYAEYGARIKAPQLRRHRHTKYVY